MTWVVLASRIVYSNSRNCCVSICAPALNCICWMAFQANLRHLNKSQFTAMNNWINYVGLIGKLIQRRKGEWKKKWTHCHSKPFCYDDVKFFKLSLFVPSLLPLSFRSAEKKKANSFKSWNILVKIDIDNTQTQVKLNAAVEQFHFHGPFYCFHWDILTIPFAFNIFYHNNFILFDCFIYLMFVLSYIVMSTWVGHIRKWTAKKTATIQSNRKFVSRMVKTEWRRRKKLFN